LGGGDARLPHCPTFSYDQYNPVGMMTRSNNPAFVFASGSSLHVASSISTRAHASPEAGARMESAQLQGATSIRVNGVSLEAIYHLEPGGLSIVFRAFDDDDPNSTQLHERLLLKPDERRIFTVRRALGQPPLNFTIARIGDAVQISAKGA